MMKTIFLYVTMAPVLLWPQTATTETPTPDTVIMASRNVQLMVYLVSGSSTSPASSTPAEKLAALEPVVKQLRS